MFLPRATALVARSESDKDISDLFIKTGRIQYIVISFVLCGFVLFGRQFIRLWAGPGYEDAYIIAIMFFVATIMDLIQNLGMTILMARNEMKFRSVLYVVVAIISLLVSIPVSKKFGGIGCAAVYSLAIVIQHIILNVYYQRKQRINIVRFWKEIMHMSTIPLILIVVGSVVVYFIDINRISTLVWATVIFAMIYIPLFYYFGMKDYERNLCNGLVGRVLHK